MPVARIYDNNGRSVARNDDLHDAEIDVHRLFNSLCDTGLAPSDVALFLMEAVTTSRCERALTKSFKKEI